MVTVALMMVVTILIWVYIYIYIYGYVKNLYSLKHVLYDPWTLGPLDPCTLGRVDPWVPRLLYPWTLGPLDPWTLGPLDPWTLEPLVPWTLGPLDPWSVAILAQAILAQDFDQSLVLKKQYISISSSGGVSWGDFVLLAVERIDWLGPHTPSCSRGRAGGSSVDQPLGSVRLFGGCVSAPYLSHRWQPPCCAPCFRLPRCSWWLGNDRRRQNGVQTWPQCLGMQLRTVERHAEG